jgi:hypothetical protein
MSLRQGFIEAQLMNEINLNVIEDVDRIAGILPCD